MPATEDGADVEGGAGGVSGVRRDGDPDDRPGGPPPSLAAELARLVEDASEGSVFRVTLAVSGPLDAWAEAQPVAAADLIGVLHEALRNARSHAAASSVRVTVTVGARCELVVADDGHGLHASAGVGGLDRAHRRAARHGGTCRVRGGDGGTGTTVVWSVPLAPSPAG